MVKKVMLLASENMCDILWPVLDDKYITLPCSDPAAGRALLRRKPDVLILELSLPGADGLTFLHEAAEMLPGKIIVLTPFVSEELLFDLEQIGVNAVLQIPFRLNCLQEQLSELIKKDPSRESGRGE